MQFSAMEFHIQFLLSFLHMGKDLSVETVILTRKASFFQKINLIEEFIRLRLHNHQDLLKKGLQLTSELQSYRKKRNSFIHGYWLINEFLIMDGIVRVSDASWDYDPKTVHYQAMTTTDVSLSELEELPYLIGGLTQRCHDFLAEMKTVFHKNKNEAQQGASASP
jgi:hypothetical protein